MIKASVVSSKGLKTRVNQTGINSMIFHFNIRRNCLQYDAIHHFSVWLRSGSNPANINRFRSNTEKRTIKLFSKVKVTQNM